MQQLDHETSEAFEGTGNPDGGGDFDEDTLGGVYVNLQPAGLVYGGVEESEEALGGRGWVSIVVSMLNAGLR